MSTSDSTKPADSMQKTARTAGFLYMLLIPLGIFGMIYIPATLYVQGDVAATARSILANEGLFRLSIASSLLTQVVQIFVVAYLYKVLKSAGRNAALLMVVFILLGVPIAMFNEVSRLAILMVLKGIFSTSYTVEQSHALVGLFLDVHKAGVFIAQTFWGLWLLPMGVLVFKSKFLPKFIGVLLVIAGVGYLVDTFMYLIAPELDITFSDFAFAGEVLITFWLLIRGVNVEVWAKETQDAA
ncbi:MAG: DUF4386 domain-containing protein [Deltaproteobacteria bacterium]|nr:DUF4386 domain-containing protein [Deltaproteobacteria bacterium]